MSAWFTAAEAAQYTGVSRDTNLHGIERREIRQVRLGGRRAIRLKPEWIDMWLELHVLEAQDQRVVAGMPLHVRSEATS